MEDSSLEVSSLAVSAELFLSCLLKTYKANWTENYQLLNSDWNIDG
jgi:hypothetical protein